MSAERILIVEDAPLLRSVLKAQLHVEGYQVEGAATISEALHSTQTEVPDLMILDLTVLDADPFAGLTDGFAFLSMLERSHPGARFPVIIYTGDPSPEVENKAQAHGVFAVVRKGIATSELVSIVRLALSEYAAQRAHA